MRVFTITRKTLLEAWRDRQLTAVYLSFPALMIMMYYLAFGQMQLNKSKHGKPASYPGLQSRP